MNNIELQAARKLLMLDVAEAAEHIGQCSPRAWQYWEAGRTAVPDDVSSAMQGFLAQRNELLQKRRQLANDMSDINEKLPLRFYQRHADYVGAKGGDISVVQWRIMQSVAAALYAEDFATLSAE